MTTAQALHLFQALAFLGLASGAAFGLLACSPINKAFERVALSFFSACGFALCGLALYAVTGV